MTHTHITDEAEVVVVRLVQAADLEGPMNHDDEGRRRA